MRVCLAETGSSTGANAKICVAFGRAETALGEAEWAATQTEHFAASVALEWWCAASSTADQTVSSRHNNATFLEIERMLPVQIIPHFDYTETQKKKTRVTDLPMQIRLQWAKGRWM
jgi:hypothetical protein